jgi:drug/metabolite transporter (DMT)-like permease
MGSPREQNIGNVERVGRVVIGAAVAVLGVVVLAASPGFWGLAGALVAIAAGLDFVITGARGYCPLYARLGHVPRSLEGAAR